MLVCFCRVHIVNTYNAFFLFSRSFLVLPPASGHYTTSYGRRNKVCVRKFDILQLAAKNRDGEFVRLQYGDVNLSYQGTI